jgi:hypothetical protein
MTSRKVTTMNPPLHRVRATLAIASAVLLAASLTACGGDDATATDDSGATTDQQGAAPSADQAGPGTLPGASGEIAAISGKTMQVQSATSGQVAVSWTAKTAFTQQVEAALADVEVGSCVLVESDADAEAGDGEPVAATAVRITEATDDGCTAGFGGPQAGVGGPGGGPTDMPSDMPTDRPTDMPSDMPSDMQVRMGGTAGEVVAVAADGFTVSTTLPGEDDPTSVEVTVAKATTYTRMADADATALEVGRCVSATGDTDSTGAVTADRVSITDPVDGQCALRMFSSRPGDDQ